MQQMVSTGLTDQELGHNSLLLLL